MGGTRDEVIGVRLTSLVMMKPTGGGTLIEAYGRVMSSGQAETIEVYSLVSGRYFQVSAVRLDQDHLTAAFRDITQTKLSEQTYRSIFDSVSDAVYVYDIDTGVVIDMNVPAEVMAGLPREQVIGTDQMEYDTDEVVNYRLGLLQRAKAGDIVDEMHQSLMRDGLKHWLDIRVRVATVSGEKRGIVFIRDVTDRQARIDRIKESEERYRSVSEMVSDYAYTITIGADGSATLVWVTDAFYRLTGYTKDETHELIRKEGVGWFFGNLIHPDDRPGVKEAWDHNQDNGPIEREYRLVRKDGSVIWLHSMAKPILSPEGKIAGFIGTAKDITDRIQAESAYHAIFDGVDDSIFVHDIATGKIIDLNTKAEKMMGLSRAEIINKVKMPHETREKGLERKRLISRAARGEVKEDVSAYIAKDGSEKWIESRFQIANVSGKKCVLTVARDITERRQFLTALTESEERYRAVSDLVSDFAFGVDFNVDGWKLGWITDAFTRLTGYTKEELVDGLSSDGFHWLLEQLVHPEDGWLIQKNIDQFKKERSIECELRILRKDGNVVWARANIKGTTKENHLVGITGSVKDISMQVQAENSYRTIFETVSDAILVLDAEDGAVLDANRNGDLMLIDAWAVNPDRRIPEGLFVDINRDNFLHILHSAAGGAVQEREWQTADAEGRQRWLNARLSNAVIGGQKRVLAVLRDVTENRRTIDAIRAREEQYWSVTDRISDWAFLIDVNEAGETHVVWTTSSIERMSGYKEAEYRAGIAREGIEFFLKMVYPNDRELIRKDFARLQVEAAVETEFRFLKPSGEVVWVHSYNRSLRDGSGKLTGFSGVYQDINARMRAEMVYQSIFESVNEGIFLLEPASGYVTDVNVRACRLFGLTREEMIGKVLPSHSIISSRAEDWQKLLGAAAHGIEQDVEWDVVDRAGSRMWMNLRMRRVQIAGGERVMAVFHDISRQKQGTDALVRSEAQMRKISELLADFAFSFRYDLDEQQGKVEWMTDTTEKVIGYKVEEMERAFKENIYTAMARFIYPDDVPHALHDLNVFISGSAPSPIEFRIVTKEGKLKWIRLMLGVDNSVDLARSIRVLGCVQDIDRQKRVEEVLSRRLNFQNAFAALDLHLSACLDLPLIVDSLLHEVPPVLQLDAIDVFLSDDAGETLKFFGGQGFHAEAWQRAPEKTGETIAQQAAKDRQPRTISNVLAKPNTPGFMELQEESFKTVYAIPLFVKGRLVGVLNFYWRSEFAIETEWADQAAAIALRAAIAIENARLVEQLQAKAQ